MIRKLQNMRCADNKVSVLRQGSQRNRRRIGRQIGILTSVFLFAACTTADDDTRRGTIGFVAGNIGVVSSEEPQASLIARDILSAGGTVGDVVAAMGFAMTVTMPSAASVGGGGLCIIRSFDDDVPAVIDFLPRSPAAVPGSVERPSAVPGLPRGLFTIHARYGNLRWAQVISPAERLARFGFDVPRAFASELGPVADALFRDPRAGEVFQRRDGQPVGEGDFLVQPSLAATLARFRTQGVGDFYLGPGAQGLVDAVQRAGGSLSVQDLRDYLPIVREPITFDWVDATTFYFAAPPAVGGAVASEALAILMDSVRFRESDAATRSHLIAEASKRAFVSRMQNLQQDGTYRANPQNLLNPDRISQLADDIDEDTVAALTSLVPTPTDWPETPAAVSFAVIDSFGGAAACTLTMNNVFGTGRMVDGYGFMLAAAPDQRGRTYTPVGPMLLSSEFFEVVYMAMASSGGVTAPTALVNVAARAAAGPETLREAMRAPRTHYSGVPDEVFVESDMPNDQIEALRNLGHDVSLTQSLGRVSAVYCPSGLPQADAEDIRCFAEADPRGHGVAIGGQ